MAGVTRYAWASTVQALQQSGLDLEQQDMDRVGMEMGSAFGGLDMLEDQVILLREKGPRRINPTLAPAVLISTTPNYIAIRLGITGPVDSRMSAAAQTAIERLPAERTLWLGFDGRAALRLLAAGDALRIEVAGSGSEAPVTRARIDNGGGLPWTLSSDERHYAIAKPGGIVVGTLGGTYEQTMFATQEAPGLLALSGRAEVLAASFAARVQIWPIGGGAPRRLQALDAPRALRLSDDGRYLLTIVSTDVATRAGSSYTLQRWQVDDPSQVLSVRLGRHLQPPSLSDLVSSDGQRLNFSGRSVDFSVAVA